ARMGPSLKTQSGAPPAATRREVSAIARSLVSGVPSAPALSGEDRGRDEPKDTPAAWNLVHSHSGTAVRLSDTSTVSSSVTLPGQSHAGSSSNTRRLTYWQSVARVGLQVAEAL